ncbi:MAG TPA: hypothetical protein VGA78_11900 [Gemmatimonadales bacterium]
MRALTPVLSTLAALSLLAAAPDVAQAGPPWISIELPANPYDASTRGAYLLVHAFHHGTPIGFPVSGRAEGIVNGERKSVTLKFERTERPGVYAMKNQWGDVGEWTLMITVSQGKDDGATALVQISEGQVFSVAVPTEKRGEWTVPRAVTLADVEATLRDRPTRVAVRR